jgi:hypothetical protein
MSECKLCRGFHYTDEQIERCGERFATEKRIAELEGALEYVLAVWQGSLGATPEQLDGWIAKAKHALEGK